MAQPSMAASPVKLLVQTQAPQMSQIQGSRKFLKSALEVVRRPPARRAQKRLGGLLPKAAAVGRLPVVKIALEK